jgi:hypothetical protein
MEVVPPVASAAVPEPAAPAKTYSLAGRTLRLELRASAEALGAIRAHAEARRAREAADPALAEARKARREAELHFPLRR